MIIPAAAVETDMSLAMNLDLTNNNKVGDTILLLLPSTYTLATVVFLHVCSNRLIKLRRKMVFGLTPFLHSFVYIRHLWNHACLSLEIPCVISHSYFSGLSYLPFYSSVPD